MSSKNSSTWDIAGVGISVLCMLHCIAVPVVLVLFPAIGAAVVPHEDQTHAFLLAFILGVAGFAFFTGYRVHGQKKPVIWMAVGVIIVTYASFFAHEQLGHNWEPVVAIIGSLALIRAHILNHKCKICEEHECHHQGLHSHDQ